MTQTFDNEGNQDIWWAQTLAKKMKVSAPKWKNYNFRKFLLYHCIFWISIKKCLKSRWKSAKNHEARRKLCDSNKKPQCMHCFLQYGQGCSSNINEVIRVVLNFLFFLRKDFARTKSTKSTKRQKHKTQISE